MPKRGILPPFGKREGRRDFINQCSHYYKNVNNCAWGVWRERKKGGINSNLKRLVEGFTFSFVSVLALLISGQLALAITSGGYARPELLTQPEDLKALIDRKDSDIWIIDVRASKEYLGEETLAGAVRPGRIPGVKWIEWREVLIKDGPNKGYWKTAEEIRELFTDLGMTPDKEIYIY